LVLKWHIHDVVVELQGMVPAMAACTSAMMERWAAQIAAGREEIDVHAELKSLTADIIAHTGFGSSYGEGKRVFELQREQQRIMHETLHTAYIPGMRYCIYIYIYIYIYCYSRNVDCLLANSE
jgi:hypothetical protein